MRNLNIRIVGINRVHFNDILNIVQRAEKEQKETLFFVHGHHVIDHLCMNDCTNVDLFILSGEPESISRLKEVVTVLASDTRKEWNKNMSESEFRKKFLKIFPKRILVFDSATDPEIFKQKLLGFETKIPI